MGVKDEILSDVLAAATEWESESYFSARKNLLYFYDTEPPHIYRRTGQLGNSPRTTGLTGGNGNYSADIYLDQGYEYSTGTYSTPKVFDEAEAGGSGIIGNSGFWQKTESDIAEAEFRIFSRFIK